MQKKLILLEVKLAFATDSQNSFHLQKESDWRSYSDPDTSFTKVIFDKESREFKSEYGGGL